MFSPCPSYPPQTIISVPVQTIAWADLAEGEPVMLDDFQVFAAGLYIPPVFNRANPSYPPQTIISVPVQTSVHVLALGALVMLIAVQVSAAGSYNPPVFV